MPNFAEPVTTSVIGTTIVLIIIVVAVGIVAVKKFKD